MKAGQNPVGAPIKSPKQTESMDGYPKKTSTTLPAGAAGKGGGK